jgi:hypothetical protein
MSERVFWQLSALEAFRSFTTMPIGVQLEGMCVEGNGVIKLFSRDFDFW